VDISKYVKNVYKLSVTILPLSPSCMISLKQCS